MASWPEAPTRDPRSTSSSTIAAPRRAPLDAPPRTKYLATQTQTLDRHSLPIMMLRRDSQIDSLSTPSTLSTAAVERGVQPEKSLCTNGPILQSGFPGERLLDGLLLTTQSESLPPHLTSWPWFPGFWSRGRNRLSSSLLFNQLAVVHISTSPLLWCARVGPVSLGMSTLLFSSLPPARG